MSSPRTIAATDATTEPPAEKGSTGRREAIRTVPCPLCGARVGEACEGLRFGRNHRDRFKAYDGANGLPTAGCRSGSSNDLEAMAEVLRRADADVAAAGGDPALAWEALRQPGAWDALTRETAAAPPHRPNVPAHRAATSSELRALANGLRTEGR